MLGRHIYIILFFLILSCKGEEIKTMVPEDVFVVGHEQPTSIVAGEIAKFTFDIKGKGNPYLLIHQGLGPLILQPKFLDNKLVFTLNKKDTRQAGLYEWELINKSKIVVGGNLKVLPKQELTTKIETYFGPRSIRAGGDDFSMLFMVPTDVYDNPLPDGTSVIIKRQMDNAQDSIQGELRNGYLWHNLFSSDHAGRMLVSATVNQISSKELTSMIAPSNSVNFKIDYKRVHDYADGNQVIEFITDEIQDRFGNTVADGTLVNFQVTDQDGARLLTAGSTLAGIATGKLLHPTKASNWKVTAYVTGESKSNETQLQFKSAVKDYEVSFLHDNRLIEVGPIHGFMEQLVPDGLLVTLKLFNHRGELVDTKLTNSIKGRASFELEERFYENGFYTINLETAGLQKEFKVALGTNELE